MQKDTSSLVFIQYLTTVFDNLGQSVLLISIEPENRYKVLLVNKTFGSTSGFPNDVVGKYVDEILPPAALEQVTARYQSALHTKQVVAYADWMETPRGHWETGAAIDTYLSKDDFSRFKELAKQADNKQQATFSLANQAGKRTFTYRLFYNPTLRRMIVHISLPMTALLCAPQLV